MDASTREALRMLEEVTRGVAPFEPVQLDDEYRRLISAVEALPQNQDGADKWEVLAQEQRLFDFYRSIRRA